MKLKKLEITNFRCFESLALDLDEQLTVLVARNGQGKTAVLDAIRIGLWSFVSGFDLARNPGGDSANSISVNDVRAIIKRNPAIDRDQTTRYDEMARQLPCEINLDAEWNIHLQIYEGILGKDKSKWYWKWARVRNSEVRGTKTKDKLGVNALKKLTRFAQDQVRNPENPEIDLPVIAYYSTKRLCSEKRLTERKSKHWIEFYMRLFSYRDCLDPASSYKHFVEWFTWIFECYREQKDEDQEKGVSVGASVWKNTIQVVQDTTNSLLQETGWHSLEYSISHGKTLILKHNKHGTLKVEQLSDGIRMVLGLVSDIAYRCIKLNPHFGLNAAKESCGVVMIDEIDMHLHPAWQQTILAGLCKAFPKIQFIVTTHSPQVISTVPDHQIRILDGNHVYSAEAGTQGAEASRILKRVFGVDPRPQNDPNTKLLNDYLDLVYADKWGQAKTKREQLDAIYKGNEPALTEADLYIENRQWELDIEKNQ